MRNLIMLAPALILMACDARPMPQASTAPAAPFVVPMDPGTIPCRQMSNPAAVDEGTGWIMGRARAALLSGRIAAVPQTLSVGEQLVAYCAANPGALVQDAAAAQGF